MTADSRSPSLALIKACRDKLTSYDLGNKAAWLLVDTAGQTVTLLRADTPLRTWPVSTATTGLDNRDGSGGTPPGVHVVGRKIGSDAPAGTVFRSRKPTGEVWTGDGDTDDDRDLILTRILTLDGREDGLNRGPGVDSTARYIYIHGTNHPADIGSPASHGCVRMTNDHVRDLFDRVDEGDPVVIV